jgi:hypothetical protein
MKINLWKATLNSVVAVGGARLAYTTSENFWVEIATFALGAFMMGSGVRWMIEDIKYEN